MDHTKQMAEAALRFATSCLMHNHQGVIDCADKIVVYCNGVKHRPESLIEFLRDDQGLTEEIGVAFDDERSCWAVVATNYQRTPVDCDEINDFLWDDLPDSDHARLYRAVQYVPVGSVPPHWTNAFYQAQQG